MSNRWIIDELRRRSKVGAHDSLLSLAASRLEGQDQESDAFDTARTTLLQEKARETDAARLAKQALALLVDSFGEHGETVRTPAALENAREILLRLAGRG